MQVFHRFDVGAFFITGGPTAPATSHSGRNINIDLNARDHSIVRWWRDGIYCPQSVGLGQAVRFNFGEGRIKGKPPKCRSTMSCNWRNSGMNLGMSDDKALLILVF